MGRIKSKAIKRVTSEIYEKFSNEVSPEFSENKKILAGIFPSKKIRNQVAGYLVRLKKMENKNKKIA